MSYYDRDSPQIFPPSPAPSLPAAIILIHGLGDTSDGLASIPSQFQSAAKLPHVHWLVPNALENRDLGTTAWYTPTRLSPYPPSRPELEEAEDEDGLLQSVAYIESLIDGLVDKEGIPVGRIVIAGFSQGHALSLLTGLISRKYAGKLAGLVGLSGYLPLIERIPFLRGERGLSERVDSETFPHVFLARGTTDRLVPKRYHRMCHEALVEFGVKEEAIEVKEYEGMGHSISGAELRDMCEWLEKVLPE